MTILKNLIYERCLKKLRSYLWLLLFDTVNSKSKLSMTGFELGFKATTAVLLLVI